MQEYGNENILVGKMAGAGHCFGIYVQSSYRYKSIYSSRIRLENKDENSLLAKIIHWGRKSAEGVSYMVMYIGFMRRYLYGTFFVTIWSFRHIMFSY